jgi:CheY-like chemotaxis protein
MVKVLIVEDDADLRDIMAEAFSQHGHEVSTAANGQEALDVLASEQSSLPDIVLLDLMMPVMDGWTFWEHMRRESRYASVPVVLLSAVPGLAREAAQLGAAGFLAKPAGIDEMLGTVARVTASPDGS